MATLSLRTVTQQMKQIDICMMVTSTKQGAFNSRPMSNNKDVTYKGDSYFFTYNKSSKVKEIAANPTVMLVLEGKSDLYLSVSGKAKLIYDKNAFKEHWVDSLNQWFADGVDTKGLVLIHVKGKKIKYWQREKEGEIALK